MKISQHSADRSIASPVFSIFQLAVLFAVLTFGAAAHSAPIETSTSSMKSRVDYIGGQIVELRAFLEECHVGKRDDAEKYTILHRLMQDYAILHSTDTIDANAVHSEWKQLLKDHPEFVRNPPPFELHEHREARKKEEALNESARQNATSWKPQDTKATYFGVDDWLLAVHQYKLAFYRLSGEKRLRPDGQSSHDERASRAKQSTPFKIMTFKHPLSMATVSSISQQLRSKSFGGYFWACTSLTSVYHYSDENEGRIMGTLGHDGGRMKWENESGEHSDFCGVLRTDGSVAYRLPVEQRYPDHLIEFLETVDGGRKALLMIGRDTDSGEGTSEVGQPSEVLFWQFPDKLETIDATDKATVRRIISENHFNLATISLGR